MGIVRHFTRERPIAARCLPYYFDTGPATSRYTVTGAISLCSRALGIRILNDRSHSTI
jgi:hypothetical protein